MLCSSRPEQNTRYQIRRQLGHSSTYKSNLMAMRALDAGTALILRPAESRAEPNQNCFSLLACHTGNKNLRWA